MQGHSWHLICVPQASFAEGARKLKAAGGLPEVTQQVLAPAPLRSRSVAIRTCAESTADMHSRLSLVKEHKLASHDGLHPNRGLEQACWP